MVDQTSSPGSAGIGQQLPSDSNSDFTVISFIVRQMMAAMDTMKPVQVKAVTGGGGALARAGTVDVLPLVCMVDGDGNATKHGVVYGVPWFRLQGGTNAVICDPQVDDIGYVIVADRDISNVKAAAAAGNNVQVNPGSYRKYNIADGIYVGGVFNAIPEQYIAFSDTGIKIADTSGNVVQMTATGITLTPATGMAVKVMGNLVVTDNLQLAGNIQSEPGSIYSGNIVTTGNVIANSGAAQVSLLAHVHPANNQPPTPGT